MTDTVKKFVPKPDRNFTVRVMDDPGFFAKELEVFGHSTREAAYKTYRRIKKELGQGL